MIEAPGRAVDAAATPLLAPPWDGLDDDALLRHLRSPRPVHIDLVVDDDECTPERLQGVLDGRFEFAGESHRLGARPDWLHNPSVDVEWHILLHKFYYAAGMARAFRRSGDRRWARRFVELADGWMDQVEPGFIAADVTGRRVQNWIYALRGFVFHADDGAAPADALPAGFVRRLLASLQQQVEHLCAHLTPKRNHRTLELYAIFLAGVALPELARAAHWRRHALDQTVANMAADLLPDGVHCELSTDYHHLALRNWLHVRTLAARHGEPLPPAMDEGIERALGFSLHVHRPDGVVPAFSDGDARSFLALLAQGAELYGRDDLRWAATRGAAGRPPEQTLATFGNSGYSVLRSGWGTGPLDFGAAQHLVFDCGPLGEGNHGHLDCLSLELYANGRPLLVDPGRFTYSEAGPVNWRVHFRGTAAHNTVCVDGRQQTRYEPRPIKQPSRHAAGTVRHKITGPAPRARLLERAATRGFALLHGRAESAEYDAVHERMIVWLGGALWLVCDRLRAPGPHRYAQHFQLHPLAQGAAVLDAPAPGVGLQPDGVARLRAPGLQLLQRAQPGLDVQLVDAWVSERYGERHPAPQLRSTLHACDADFDTLIVTDTQVLPCLQALPAQGAACTGLALRVDGDGRSELWFHAGTDTGGPWRIGDLALHGRWAHLSLRDDGTPLQATTHAGATLQFDGRPLAVRVADAQGQP